MNLSAQKPPETLTPLQIAAIERSEQAKQRIAQHKNRIMGRGNQDGTTFFYGRSNIVEKNKTQILDEITRSNEPISIRQLCTKTGFKQSKCYDTVIYLINQNKLTRLKMIKGINRGIFVVLPHVQFNSRVFAEFH